MKMEKNLNTPRNIVFFITSRCNANCKHCFLKNLNKGEKDITLNKILKIVSSLNKPANINLTGGEPFLRNDLKIILKELMSNKNINSIAISTNGSFPEKIKEIVEYLCKNYQKNLEIYISLDGFEKTHDKIRGLKNCFKNAIESCEVSKQLSKKYKNFSFRINITLMKQNLSEIEPLIDFLESKKYPSLFTPVRGNSFSSFNLCKEFESLDYNPKKNNSFNSSLNPEEIKELILKIEKKRSRYFIHYSKGPYKDVLKIMIRTLHFKKRQIECFAGYTDGVIYNDASVGICEQLKPFGNLKSWDFNFLKAWNSKEANKQREKSKSCACIHGCNLFTSAETKNHEHLLSRLKNNAYKFRDLLWDRF